MSKEITIVINETIVANVGSLSGITTMFVLNGAWDGSLDWLSKEYFPSRYPTNVIRISSWRMATPGDIANYRKY